MMTASRPPPLAMQVLEEFDSCSMHDDRMILIESRYVAHADLVRERDRERKSRTRAEALADLRRAEGSGERVCPTCGVVFVVELGAPGRRRVRCSPQCRWRAAVKAWRERWFGSREEIDDDGG